MFQFVACTLVLHNTKIPHPQTPNPAVNLEERGSVIGWGDGLHAQELEVDIVLVEWIGGQQSGEHAFQH